MGKFEDRIIIVGKECEDCRYCEIVEESRARVFVYCGIKEKRYYYGQCIPCNLKETVKNGEQTNLE